jgi:acetyl-CoA/propionyl-CoA carboxylase biotin carboxyl carrier protein
MFGKILIANRGEIAIRVIRACEELGIKTVAVYSELDRDALHVQRADEAYLIGPAEAAKSYLNVDKIVEVVKESGAEAVHPGYGFLSENATFVKRLEDEGITFIGPPASAIDSMGSKTKARDLMKKAGVPIVPGTTESVDTYEDALRIANDEIGFPVAVKAASGGGGKGFRVALTEDKLKDAYEGASREGEKFFSDGTVYLERYLPNPRHVEVQVIADTHGNVIHLGERDCSIQRRHQKLIEEAPAPDFFMDEELRQRIGKIGVDAAKAVNYVGAGTIEGMLQDGEYFFLEMNTRVQVEHCVTEAVTGIDIVKQGIRAAAGLELDYKQEDVFLRGHAIECRINAENPSTFLPSPGKITSYHPPGGLGVRVDSAVYQGYTIPPYYDSMVGKLIVHGKTRTECLMRLKRALDEFVVDGIETTLPLFRKLVRTQDIIDGDYHIHWLERFLAEGGMNA